MTFLDITPLSTTLISFVPYMWACTEVSIPHQDRTRAMTQTLGEGTAQSEVWLVPN